MSLGPPLLAASSNSNFDMRFLSAFRTRSACSSAARNFGRSGSCAIKVVSTVGRPLPTETGTRARRVAGARGLPAVVTPDAGALLLLLFRSLLFPKGREDRRNRWAATNANDNRR